MHRDTHDYVACQSQVSRVCTQINEHDAAKWTAGVHHVANRCTIAVRVGAAGAAQGGAACDRATASGLSEGQRRREAAAVAGVTARAARTAMAEEQEKHF